MTEVFFKLIPQILFEPIAVGALLGLFTALIFFWKKHGKFYWIVTVSIVFMLGWRLAIQIVSTRYASILIYPAVIFCVYFCFQLEDLCKLIPKFPERLRRMVPWLFLIGLSIASLVKAFHYNPYENYIRSNCSTAKQDAAKFARPLALADPREVRRYHYYSGVKTLGAPALDFPGNTVNPAVIKSFLTRYSPQCDVLYLFIVEFKFKRTSDRSSSGDSPGELETPVMPLSESPQEETTPLIPLSPAPKRESKEIVTRQGRKNNSCILKS